MIEYIKHIDEYREYWYSSYSKLVPLEQWGNKALAEAYLNKYWLREQDYQKNWKPIQNNVFYQDKGLPDLVYRLGFTVIALEGGSLFTEEDFKQLQNAMLEVGDDSFVIIQRSQESMQGEPMFRMKFPVNVTWDELMSGNYISAVLFEMNYNEYFVFSESGSWGKYSANDYVRPLDLIGFNSELYPIFKKYFKQSQEEQEEIQEWLPREYKVLMK